MVSEDELARFLDGSLGIAALDIGRELVALREHNQALQVEVQRLIAQSERFAAVAEAAQGAHASAKDQLNSLCTSLSSMAAGLTDFLKCP